MRQKTKGSGNLESSWMGRPNMKTAIASVLVAACISANASAMSIELRGERGDPRRVIHLEGDIKPGDVKRIRKVIADLRKRHEVLRGFVIMNSPGGEVLESFYLMDLFANTQLPILIKGDCLSACGFIAAGLAATGNLYLDETAAVAVHRVYDLHGRDDLQASLEAAQMLAEDGVPPSIVYKIVSTSSTRLSDITGDLRLMLATRVRN